jgi:hypothetical protein
MGLYYFIIRVFYNSKLRTKVIEKIEVKYLIKNYKYHRTKVIKAYNYDNIIKALQYTVALKI